MSLEISQEISQEKTFGLRNFQKHLFYRTLLDDCFWLFRATLLKWSTANNVWKNSDEYSLPRNANLRSTANNVWKNSDEYSLPRNANLRSTVQVYFFLGSINFQCMFSLVYTAYCQKQPSEQRCSVKKGVLKDFVNFMGKHQCWSLFLITLQA